MSERERTLYNILSRGDICSRCVWQQWSCYRRGVCVKVKVCHTIRRGVNVKHYIRPSAAKDVRSRSSSLEVCPGWISSSSNTLGRLLPEFDVMVRPSIFMLCPLASRARPKYTRSRAAVSSSRATGVCVRPKCVFRCAKTPSIECFPFGS